MLNRISPAVYNETLKMEFSWIQQEYALFARLKNHTIVSQEARKEKMDMPSNAKYVDWLKIGNITRKILKSFLQNMKDGLNEIRKTFSKTKEHITNAIKNESWKNCESQEKQTDIEIQKPIVKEIGKRLIVTILLLWQLSWVISKNLISVRNAKTIVCLMPITMIIPNLWMLFGYVENVMEKSIEYLYQRERLNPTGAKAHAIVRPAQRKVLRSAEMTDPLFLRGNKAGSGIQQAVLSTKDNALQTIYGYRTYDQQEFREE